jgi:glycosyltransferase involved in cell wall biosynthesis
MNGLRSVITSGWRSFRSHRSQGDARGSCSDRRPHLLVDVSVIMRHDAQTGIQRVVRAVWTNLLERLDSTFDAVPVFATRSHGYRYASPDFLARPPAERLPGKAVCVQPGDKFLGLDLSAHLLPSHQRQISRWRARGVTSHLVVYDLLPLQRPQWFNESTVRNFGRWIETVRHHSDQALCISDHVATDLREFLDKGTARPDVGRLRLAGDIEGSFPSRGIDEQVSIVIQCIQRMPAILMVGTIEPRKAYDVALAAFDHLWQRHSNEAPALVIVGKPGWRTEGLQNLIRNHPEQGRRLFWLTDVSDEDLGRLYGASSAVFLASHAEGFGLPAMEAAMHGRHALVRDLAVFREQKLANLSYFVDDKPVPLAAQLFDLVRRSARRPAASALPGWNDCVTDLLHQIGLGESVATTPLAERSCAAT